MLEYWYSSRTLLIYDLSEISGVKLSPEPIPRIDCDIWRPRCIFVCPKWNHTHCWIALWSPLTPIPCHQASNSIKQMHKPVMSQLCSFDVIPYILLSSWPTLRSVSVILQVVAVVSTSDRLTEIAHSCQQSCVPPHKPLLAQHFAFE